MAAHPDHSKQLPAWEPQVHRTQPPNPGWKWGEAVDSTKEGKEWLEGVKGGWETFDMKGLDHMNLLSLMTSAIVPRPIALISTRSEEGVDNIAPYSFFNVASVKPPVLGFAAEVDADRGIKDTALNIAATGEFVVNIASELWVEQLHAAFIDSPHDQEEWGFTGLKKVPSELVKPPRVRESGVSIECKFLHKVPIIDPETNKLGTEYIFGSVEKMHIRKDMLTYTPKSRNPQVDPEVLQPLARMGDISYAALGDIFRVPIYTWGHDKNEALKGAEQRQR